MTNPHTFVTERHPYPPGAPIYDWLADPLGEEDALYGEPLPELPFQFERQS